jgi:hypothetical protein
LRHRRARSFRVLYCWDAKVFADWDNWVNQQVAARDAAQAAMMKEANLSAPLPGLADMQGQGRFFSCAPYGREPSHGWSGAQPAADGPDTDTAQAVPGRFDNSSSANFLQVAQVSGSAPAGTERQILDEDLFPCSPLRVTRLITTDLTTGNRQTTDLGAVLVRSPYSWTVCHTGSWIRRRHRYAWVAGTKRHHICPVHWVKYGHVRGFVPIHPRDVAGKPPLNLQHGVFVPADKQGDTLERVAFKPGTSVKLLGGPPKEFERPYLQPLQRAEEPHLEAYLAKDGAKAGAKNGIGVVKGTGVRPIGTPITFDRRSQSFVLAHQVTQGGRTTTIAEHFGGEGVRGGFSHSGGGGSGSFGRSGSGGGGSSHSSGSSGSSGGGGHASGGGASSSGGGGGGAHK